MNASTVVPSIEQMAQAIKAAYADGYMRGAEAVGSFFAEQIEVVHEPSMPGDGVRDGAPLRGHQAREMAAFNRALRGFRQDTQVDVEGDCLVLTMSMQGRRGTGQEIDETVTAKFRVANGRIMGMRATAAKPSSFGVLAEVLVEGGFTLPTQ